MIAEAEFWLLVHLCSSWTAPFLSLSVKFALVLAQPSLNVSKLIELQWLMKNGQLKAPIDLQVDAPPPPANPTECEWENANLDSSLSHLSEHLKHQRPILRNHAAQQNTSCAWWHISLVFPAPALLHWFHLRLTSSRLYNRNKKNTTPLCSSLTHTMSKLSVGVFPHELSVSIVSGSL